MKSSIDKIAKTLLESTGEGIYGIDMEGKCTFLNRAGAKALGLEPEAAVGLFLAADPDVTDRGSHGVSSFRKHHEGRICRKRQG